MPNSEQQPTDSQQHPPLERLRQIDAKIALLVQERSEIWEQLLKRGLAHLGQAVGSLGVAYLGPEHSYSHAAALKFFGSAHALHPVASIAAVFEEVQRGQSRYGVVPIENSTDAHDRGMDKLPGGRADILLRRGFR